MLRSFRLLFTLFYLFIFAFFRRVREIARNDLASSRPSACISVRMEQLGFHWTDFREILIFEHFCENLSRNSKFDYIGQE